MRFFNRGIGEKRRLELVEESAYKTKNQLESVLTLLGIGFYGDTDYPHAGFIDKKKTRGEKE